MMLSFFTTLLFNVTDLPKNAEMELLVGGISFMSLCIIIHTELHKKVDLL